MVIKSEKEEKTPEEFEGFVETQLQSEEALRKAHKNIIDVLDYYMDLDKETKNIVALWIVGTYFHKNYASYPYLFVNAMRGSGKTRLLRIITCLSKDGAYTTSLTESVMFRTKGTLGLDEFENLGSKEKTSLRELLNASYKKGVKVMRMRKAKTAEGEEQVVESFDLFRPVVMANIWGMEEVLGDRCITISLEKSDDGSKTKLIENFEDLEIINYTKNLLNYVCWCSLCSVVSPRNMYNSWNVFVKNTTPHTLTTHITLTTLTTLDKNESDEDFNYLPIFEKINETGIDGRNLELFMPLFLISSNMSDTLLDETIEYSKKFVKDKRLDELTESRDVSLYSLIAKETEGKFRDIKELTDIFKIIMGEEMSDWLNTRWMGRALKRLNLIQEKRRMGKGVQVVLNVQKAKKKEMMFRPTQDENKEEKEGEEA